MQNRRMSINEARVKAMNWCSKMERSKFDVQFKLYSWGLDQNQIKEVVEKLESDGFLSSGRYIEAYIKGKLYYKKWGKVKIKYNLKLKGFSDELIDKYIDELIDEDFYLEMIIEQLKKKSLAIDDDDEYIRKSKLIRFGQSRGYETEISLMCVDKL